MGKERSSIPMSKIVSEIKEMAEMLGRLDQEDRNKVIGVAAGLELARAEAAKSTEAASDTERKGA